jgi:tRNA threonylcarbamoyl adenosine modification protein (Sua5/YciO/YrdC/YwlC family)
MLIEMYPENPEPRKIAQVVEILRNGGVIIYPTDTIYAFGCDINNPKAIERICRIKGIDPKKSHLSFICSDLGELSNYVKPIDNSIFRDMKANLPGPFTYILNANNTVPKLFKNKKKTVGIRIPDNTIALELVERLGNPILSSSVKNDDDDILEYFTDAFDIHEKYGNLVEIVIDGGVGGSDGSTIVDCTGNEPIIVR